MAPKLDPASLGTGRTVTAQGEAAALRRERDPLSAVLDTAGALVVLLDPERRVVRFNRACEVTTGYSSKEARGQVLWDLLVLPEEVTSVRAVLSSPRGPIPQRTRRSLGNQDRNRRLIAWSGAAIADADAAEQA